MRRRGRWALGVRCWALGAGGWVLALGLVWTQRPALSTQPPTPDAQRPTPNAPAEEIGEHQYRIGRVVVDTAAKLIRMPCRVNMRRGMIEFLAVASEGKLHESVLLAEAEPLHIHLALLLLGLEPGRGVRYHGDMAPPSGPGVEARVEWQASGVRRWASGVGIRSPRPKAQRLTPTPSCTARLEELAWDIPARRPMPPVAWLFTGVMPPGPGPRMEEERSVVATYRDPGAVLTNPLPTGADDSVYKVNERLVPPVGTPMTLLLRPAMARPNQPGAGGAGSAPPPAAGTRPPQVGEGPVPGETRRG